MIELASLTRALPISLSPLGSFYLWCSSAYLFIRCSSPQPPQKPSHKEYHSPFSNLSQFFLTSQESHQSLANTGREEQPLTEMGKPLEEQVWDIIRTLDGGIFKLQVTIRPPNGESNILCTYKQMLTSTCTYTSREKFWLRRKSENREGLKAMTQDEITKKSRQSRWKRS